MEAILKFSLPEEATEHKQAVNGAAWESVVWELDQTMRGFLKYGHDDLKTTEAVLENLREKIREEMIEEGLQFSP
jgi:hypothetical protein